MVYGIPGPQLGIRLGCKILLGFAHPSVNSMHIIHNIQEAARADSLGIGSSWCSQCLLSPSPQSYFAKMFRIDGLFRWCDINILFLAVFWIWTLADMLVQRKRCLIRLDHTRNYGRFQNSGWWSISRKCLNCSLVCSMVMHAHSIHHLSCILEKNALHDSCKECQACNKRYHSIGSRSFCRNQVLFTTISSATASRELWQESQSMKCCKIYFTNL